MRFALLDGIPLDLAEEARGRRSPWTTERDRLAARIINTVRQLYLSPEPAASFLSDRLRRDCWAYAETFNMGLFGRDVAFDTCAFPAINGRSGRIVGRCHRIRRHGGPHTADVRGGPRRTWS